MKITDLISTSRLSFNQLFKERGPEELSDNVFTLLGKECFAITAGTEEHYNSMVGSGGGLGTLFRKPVAWCIVRTDRYTLELMRKEQTYTLSYFPEEYRQEMLLLGSRSGRDSEKMKETRLTAIRTPSGTISFKEARLIMECRLTQITTPAPGDFYTTEAKEYIREAYQTASDYRHYVFGEITHFWIRREELCMVF